MRDSELDAEENETESDHFEDCNYMLEITSNFM